MIVYNIRVYSYCICTLSDYVNFHRRETQNGTFCHYLCEQWKERCERNRREAADQENTEDGKNDKDTKKEERDKLSGADQKKPSNSQGDGTDGDENIEMLPKP